MLEGVRFSHKEVSMLFFTIIATAVVLFLVKWRTENFSIGTGIAYLVFSLLCIAGIYVFILCMQKRYAYSLGYEVVFDNSIPYMLVGLLLTFLMQAYIFIIVPGMIALKTTPRRIGAFRPEIHDKDIGVTSLLASVTCFACFAMFGILYALTGVVPLYEIAKFALLIGLFTLVPTPITMGLGIFKWQRSAPFYGIVFLFIFGVVLLYKEPFILFFALLGMSLLFIVGVLSLSANFSYRKT